MTEFDVKAVDLSGILNTSAEQKAKQLPDPKTFHILCVVPEDRKSTRLNSSH